MSGMIDWYVIANEIDERVCLEKSVPETKSAIYHDVYESVHAMVGFPVFNTIDVLFEK